MSHSKYLDKGIHALLGVILPLLLLVVGGAILWLIQRPDPPKVPGLGSDEASLLSVMPAAQVEPILPLTEALDLAAAGAVVPYREIVLAAEVGGRVIDKEQSVRPGHFVRKGQLLLQIDPRDYQYEVDRITQRLSQEQVSLRENEQEIQNTDRLLELAQSQFDLAEADYKRTANLQQNVASQSELGAAKQSMLSALNQRVTLQNQADTLRTRRLRLELIIQTAETELQQALLNLQRTQIHSPVDGIVVSEQIETDSYVQRGSNLMTIEDVSRAEVSCSLRMDQLFWILDQGGLSHDRSVGGAVAMLQQLPQVEAKVRFRLGGRESLIYEWAGRLDRFDGSGLDPQNRMVPVRIVVDNPQQYRVNGRETVDGNLHLVRGMFVDVVLKAQPATQLLLVPKLSVKPATDSHRIWKFEPDRRALEVVQRRQGLQSADADAVTAEQQHDLKPKLVSDRSAAEAAGSPTAGGLDPTLWQVGFLRVLDGVNVIGAYFAPDGSPTDYLVCHAPGVAVQPGDFVVVTPIPGIESKEEPIRVSKENLSPEPSRQVQH